MGTFDFTGMEGPRFTPRTKALRVFGVRKLANPLNHFPHAPFHPMIRTDQFPQTFSTGTQVPGVFTVFSIG